MSHKHSPIQPACTLVATDYLKNLGSDPIAEVDQLKDRLLRTVADFDNYRKRAAREKEDAIKFANESLLEQLLPVLDSFELGLEAAKENTDPIVQGMQLAYNQLLNVLKQVGVEPIDALGHPFDPHWHEAVSHQEVETADDGIVLQQLRKGYKLKDRLLRPATVIVAKGKEVSY
ncbi:MAG: nucleotide exchange factor GrpE [Verrucomicrobiae bacterium]|nr:nucleotide exchange factor GrpE [Verrucomicrobiae bacterium]